jgi:hypothetical protein
MGTVEHQLNGLVGDRLVLVHHPDILTAPLHNLAREYALGMQCIGHHNFPPHLPFPQHMLRGGDLARFSRNVSLRDHLLLLQIAGEDAPDR